MSIARETLSQLWQIQPFCSLLSSAKISRKSTRQSTSKQPPNTATGRKKRVHRVQPRVETPTEPADNSSEEDYVFSVNKINSVSCPKELETSVTLNDWAEIKMMIDTKLEKNKERIFAYGSKTPISLLEKVTTEIQIQKLLLRPFM